MKRDMDLIRQILLKVEEDSNPTPNMPNLDLLTIPNCNWYEVSEHIRLLVEADYLDAMQVDYGLCPNTPNDEGTRLCCQHSQ